MSWVQMVARGEEPDGYLDGAPLCPRCLCLTDSGWISPTYRVRNRHHSVTAESGLKLVSQRFVDAVEGEGIVPLGCRFVPLPADPEYYGLIVERVLTVDRSSVEHEGMVCPVCRRQPTFGRPKVISGAGAEPLRGFARSDLEYGGTASRPTGQAWRTFLDLELAKKLRSLKLCQFRPLDLV
ncbi:MAG TPA: hypothetical protein PK020_00925 [Ilumatobacteraceae bacterium]|nr:hypothetical protein [Ilumatobacteraceae bacterium]